MSEQQTMSMVERVARAIFDKVVGPNVWGSKHYADQQKVSYISARAALEAMRECDLVYRNDEGQIVHELRGPPNVIWKTMIDAALAPLANSLEEKVGK